MIKNYYLYEENNEKMPIAKLTIHETLYLKEESIEVTEFIKEEDNETI